MLVASTRAQKLFFFFQSASEPPPTPAFPLLEHISEPLNRILDYETMGAFCGALQNHLPVVAQSGSQTQTSSQAMSLSA